MRTERIRKRLLWAGISWWAGLAWLLALIAVSVAGGSESNQNLVLAVVFGSGTIASVALLLAGYLVGRRNADWWRPRLKEVLPDGSDAPNGDRGIPKRASQKRNERREKARYATAKEVRSQLREAGLHERRRRGDGTLLGEPILVLHCSRDRALDVFDQEGNELGRVVRVLDRTSKAEGDVWIAEIRDADGETVLALRLALRRRRPKHAPVKTGSYALCSADGKHVAAIGPSKVSNKRSYRPVTAGGQLLAHIEEHNSTISDADRRKIADITEPFGISSQPGWYVIDRVGVVDQPLSSVILAACIIRDDTRVERN